MIVEGAGKQSCKKFDRVWQINGNIPSSIVLDMLANDVYLSSDIRYEQVRMQVKQEQRTAKPYLDHAQ